MVKILLIILSIFFAIIIVSNVIVQKQDCSYSNYSGSFTFEEMNFKGRDFAMCLIKFDEFKSLKKADTVLYRVCKKKLLHFWRYRDYLFGPRYNLPYISWQQISLRRGQLKNKSGFQDF